MHALLPPARGVCDPAPRAGTIGAREQMVACTHNKNLPYTATDATAHRPRTPAGATASLRRPGRRAGEARDERSVDPTGVTRGDRIGRRARPLGLTLKARDGLGAASAAKGRRLAAAETRVEPRE